jgi:folate-binding protein YgfZ
MTHSRAQKAASQGALIVPAPSLGTLAVTGRDRISWLNGLITSDLSKLSPGRASYGLVLQKIGRIVAAVWVLEAGERLLVAVPRERASLLSAHFERYLIMEDASVADVSDAYSWAFVHGPRSQDMAALLAAQGVLTASLDATGMGGAVLAAPASELEALQSRAAQLGPDVVVGTDQDWEALRIARFVPRFGVDFSDKNYPQEAALEKVAVSFNKGCYLGQEVVCRLEMRGHVTKKIVPVRVFSAEPPAPGAEVRSLEGRVLGTVSSAATEGETSAALAMIRFDFADPGTALEIGGARGEVLERPAWA